MAAELEGIYQDERTVSVKKMGVLLAVFVVVLAVNIAKGGGGYVSPFGMRCGSPGFWYVRTYYTCLRRTMSLTRLNSIFIKMFCKFIKIARESFVTLSLLTHVTRWSHVTRNILHIAGARRYLCSRGSVASTRGCEAT